jgi:hypothetical protein
MNMMLFIRLNFPAYVTRALFIHFTDAHLLFYVAAAREPAHQVAMRRLGDADPTSRAQRDVLVVKPIHRVEENAQPHLRIGDQRKLGKLFGDLQRLIVGVQNMLLMLGV